MATTTAPKPGPTHPDVAILKSVFLDMQSGEMRTYDTIAAAIGLSGKAEVFRQRALTARNQLRNERLAVIACVRGEGYLRETPAQTLARTTQSSRPSIRRKARKIGQQLASIDPTELSEEARGEFFTERTVNNVVFSACSGGMRKKLLASTQQAHTMLPMAKALAIMTGDKPRNTTDEKENTDETDSCTTPLSGPV